MDARIKTFAKNAGLLTGAALAGLAIAAGILYIGNPAGLERRQVFSDTVKTYKLVSLKQPKHFRVTLQDIQTGKIYENVNVSKHCNRWREVKIGGLWDIHEVVYVYPKAKIYQTRLEGVRTICPR